MHQESDVRDVQRSISGHIGEQGLAGRHLVGLERRLGRERVSGHLVRVLQAEEHDATSASGRGPPFDFVLPFFVLRNTE